jgi:hypothetical protein
MTLLAVTDATALAILGLLLLWFAAARFRRRRAKSSDELSSSQPSAITRIDGPHRDAPSALAQWEVAMHETARELMGRLDTKIVIVEQLVRQAQEVADRIEGLLARLEEANARHDSASLGSPRPQPADRSPPAGE